MLPIVQGGGSAGSGSGSGDGAAQTARSTHYELLRELAHKRIATFIYLKRAHEGRTYYLNTTFFTPELVASLGDESTLLRRAYVFYALGQSLGSLLDMSNIMYFTKALNTLAQEYDTFAAEAAKTKRRVNLRKMRMPGDGTSSTNSDSHSSYTSISAMLELPTSEGSEYARLDLQRPPFEIDYWHTLYTLCDTFCEVYSKLLEGATACCDHNYWELVSKLDARFKKIISLLVKEMDVLTRRSFKEEFAAIDPLLASAGGAMVHDDADNSSIYSL
ncbi:hypothetical protein THASP1DRAFT_30629 [Thamnocephalis sphaerospora]|uniref:Uncharacterized protein n=1 Tax=Thamnocephalis sphaerospora TaxID=78915 RepID=A0A4P9XQ17_9FUNG|nr:hypothetical protein THASP1DRAFT_30629 [Thamnocephalis sphaerospora]|eukprot:RKP07561.1 hypothetical protein THASP1DRAFT_30629 [Thamnocephalis sphaerospora]